MDPMEKGKVIHQLYGYSSAHGQAEEDEGPFLTAAFLLNPPAGVFSMLPKHPECLFDKSQSLAPECILVHPFSLNTV